jgi:hypothetical protein
MSNLTNAEYFARRASFERLVSLRAVDSELADAHAHMAAQYEALAREFEGEPARIRTSIR